MSAVYSYELFGLRIASDLQLPGLSPGSDGTPFDIEISRGPVTPDGFEVGASVGPFAHAADHTLWLQIPDVARYLVREGRQLVYEPAPDVDDDSLRVFMMGTCFGALLQQRGLLVLHGNAFEVGDGCAICVGPSGVGKSTLAARMMQRGHRVIADDVCPVDEEGRVVPGMARLKLWQEAAQELEITTGGLERVRPRMAKFAVPLGESFLARPAPVKAIYVLTPWNQDQFVVEDVSDIAKFQALRANSYRFRFLRGMGLGPRHLQQCSALASGTPVARISRPRAGFDIDGLADVILADLARRGAA